MTKHVGTEAQLPPRYDGCGVEVKNTLALKHNYPHVIGKLKTLIDTIDGFEKNRAINGQLLGVKVDVEVQAAVQWGLQSILHHGYFLATRFKEEFRPPSSGVSRPGPGSSCFFPG